MLTIYSAKNKPWECSATCKVFIFSLIMQEEARKEVGVLGKVNGSFALLSKGSQVPRYEFLLSVLKTLYHISKSRE